MAPSPSKERKTVYDIRRLVYTTWQRNRIENSKLNEIDGISSAKRAFHRLCSSNRATDYYDSIEREKENHPLSIHWPHSSISLCFHSPFGRDVPRFLTNSSRFAHFLTDFKSDEFAATIFGVVADVWMDGSR